MSNQAATIVKTILSHLKQSGQLDLLASVVEGLQKSPEYQNSKNRVTLTSASAMTAAELAQVHRYLKKSLGSAYDLSEIIDPTLVGGFTLQVNDTFIDASVLGKINSVHNKLTAKE